MTTLKLSPNASGAGSFTIAAPSTSSDFTLNLPSTLGTNNGSALVSTDASGNLGLGVTPSAWASVTPVFQVNRASFYGYSNEARMSANYYYDAGDKYIASDYATSYSQRNGQHVWYTAPSGTAGNAISFTQAMTLDASGRLGVGTTSPQYRFHAFSSTASEVALLESTVLNSDNVQLRFKGFSGERWAIGNNVATGGTGVNFDFYDLASSALRARIDSSGNLLVGITSGSNHRICNSVLQGSAILQSYSTAYGNVSFQSNSVTTEGFSTSGAAVWVGKNGGTSRSINAGGTVNASGADYAEYMTKAGDFTVAKGDVVGINADGKLTNVFADAVSFCVKSTDPSYVGGDIWGNEDAIGKRPADDATDEEKAAYADALEAARQKVDRIAFAGQVPVNVMGATPGQYIVPVNDNGAIKGVAKNEADMTMADYMKAVGKVIAVKEDGRAFIIVKVA